MWCINQTGYLGTVMHIPYTMVLVRTYMYQGARYESHQVPDCTFTYVSILGRYICEQKVTRNPNFARYTYRTRKLNFTYRMWYISKLGTWEWSCTYLLRVWYVRVHQFNTLARMYLGYTWYRHGTQQDTKQIFSSSKDLCACSSSSSINVQHPSYSLHGKSMPTGYFLIP